jgi:hypothetical protein
VFAAEPERIKPTHPPLTPVATLGSAKLVVSDLYDYCTHVSADSKRLFVYDRCYDLFGENRLSCKLVGRRTLPNG